MMDDTYREIDENGDEVVYRVVHNRPGSGLAPGESVSLYRNAGRIGNLATQPCCPSSQIDSVRDASCLTIGSVYRCENCDLSFPRADAKERFCLFCATLPA